LLLFVLAGRHELEEGEIVMSRTVRLIFWALGLALGVLGCETSLGGNSPERLQWSDRLVLEKPRITVSVNGNRAHVEFVIEALSKQGLSVELADPPTSAQTKSTPHLHFVVEEIRSTQFPSLHFLLTAFTATALPYWETESAVIKLEVMEPGAETSVREVRNSYVHVLWAPLVVWTLAQALDGEWDPPFEHFIKEMVTHLVGGMETR
jgi:hypothetical protein